MLYIATTAFIRVLTLSNALAYTGTLASSLVLLMDLFHAIDTDEADSSIKEVSTLYIFDEHD